MVCLSHGLASFLPTLWQIGKDLKLDKTKKIIKCQPCGPDTLKGSLHGLEHEGHGSPGAKSYFKPL